MKSKKVQIGLLIIIILTISFFLSGRDEIMPLSPEQMNNDLNVEGTESSRTENKDELEEMVNIPEEDKLGNEDKEAASKNNEKTYEELVLEQKDEKKQIISEDNKNKDKKDKYLTDPVSEGKPEPIEWQDVTIEKDKAMKATLSVTCKSILNNIDMFDEEKLEVLPEDGVIYAPKEVVFYEGESVFDLLLREMQDNKIHMEFVMTPIYNSNYVEGINNIYEFDCGELSGWMYRVNGWFPNYGASRYQLEDGDVVEWIYTCDLGRDIGGRNVITGGEE